MADPNDFAHHPKPNVPWAQYEEALAAASRAGEFELRLRQLVGELTSERDALKRQLKAEQDPRYRDPDRRRRFSNGELEEIAARAFEETPGFQDDWAEALQPFLRSVATIVAREVVDLFREDGFCTFDFHAPIAEFDSEGDDAVCNFCEKTRAEHHVLACAEPTDDGSQETNDQTRE